MAQTTVFKKVLKDPLGAGGMFIILLAFFVAVFAYLLIPDHTPNANQMNLAIAGKKPGFTVEVLRLQKEVTTESTWWEQLLNGKDLPYREVAVAKTEEGENILKYTEYTGSGDGIEKSIDRDQLYAGDYLVQKKFHLGTDKYGRDLLSRLLLGARISFSVGFVSVFISLIIGIPMGAIAGYYGGFVDKLIMWIINVVWSIPTLLLVIAITLALGKGFWQVFIAVGFTMWVEVARVVRGQILSVKEKEYIQAAHVLGFSDFRIIFKHILPNVLAPVIVISAANFAAAILIESGLSFLGIGAQPPMPSWGGMIKDHYAYLIVDKAYLAIAPGIAIMLLVLSFMMLGNSLRDALDVRKV
ncbi:ABC-type dipeptide/oligopeptide/nickel transport system, permease component [Owenweeksia hongkongensis DSM 17368]|uniref:ABC-type dipeptide/oligopeptide/nickel transport system, permease component n=1 Tax=Owenweeksia hongkongensis (strain DSM 17368 / CIP 108786 / JCM 12287 / NRRL B-23963 / UST20020801) TaxID=926562 RepID=G8R0V5_OWEHD|nr:ABC-type dipeptide/oligopeptide/nickel transport system, permease component [Owenweeksia hongkongensis DSM 17368]